MNKVKINCRLEGGLGDHLLAVRFIPAIKDLYPNSNIKVYTDTCGKTFQAEALMCAYSNLIDEIVVIKEKKYKEFYVDCQFGVDNYYGALENVPDYITKEMVSDCDVFYDLHIDSLKWMSYDFDFLKYFYTFPKTNKFEVYQHPFVGKKYVVMHLHSATSVGHCLKQYYIDGVVKKISEHNKVILISTKESNHLFNHLANENVFIFNGSVREAFSIISSASVMVSTDSGFRYIAYASSVPVITFSANALGLGIVPPSHAARWLIYPSQCAPLNYNYIEVSKAVDNIMYNKGAALNPFVNNFDLDFVNRRYTINKEKTK